jgi:acyl carrier protein
MSGDLEARVNTIFRDLFDDPGLTVTRQTTAQDVEGWDSLSHIDLIVAIEKEFAVRFTTAEVTGMKSVGDLYDLVARKAG